MLARMQRHRNAGHRANLARPHAAGIDDVIGLDRALVSHYASDAAIGLVDVGDLDALDDFRAVIARALGKRLGDVDRIRLSVLRQPDAADRVIDRQAGVTGLDVRRADLVDLDTKGTRHGGGAAKLFHPLVGQGNGDRPVALETGGHTGLFLEPEIQLLRVFRQPRHVLRRAKLRDQPGGVPGGAAGQLLALEKNNVGPAELA